MKNKLKDPVSLIERLQTGVVVHGADTSLVYANPRALELLRLTKEQALGRDAFDPQWMFVDGHGQPMAEANYPVNRVHQTRKPVENQEVGITDGSGAAVTWVLCSAYPEFGDADGSSLSSIVVTFYDITQRKKAIPFEAIVESANDAVVVTEASPIDDHGPKIVYVNRAAESLTGWRHDEMIGRTPRMLQGPGTDRDVLDDIRRALLEKTSVRSQLLNYRKDHSSYWIELNLVPLRNEFGDVTHYAAIERDISELKARESDLLELSIRDPLTGALNRRGFMELIEPAAALMRRQGGPATVAALDLDHFKSINDDYGHAGGDAALKAFAQRLEGLLRGSDVIGRMGGEEFAVLLVNTDIDSAFNKMDSLREEIAAMSVPAGGARSIRMTVSIGLAPLELTDRSVSTRQAMETALSTADAALYRAKLTGRNRVRASDTDDRKT